ncbi:MAG TPA: hypothetical protein VKE69_15070 [Planctomycetota bacterium]|nr:hypothetical protein [Planctomycetota bacterium]
MRSLLLAVVLAPSLPAQSTKVLEVNGSAAAGGFGWSVDGAGDANADGVPDLIGGAPLASGSTGRAKLVSGANGATLQTFNGPVGFAMFGGTAAGLGDLDADGKGDVAVGCFYSASTIAQFARVFSGNDGSLVHSFTGGTGEGLGTALSRVGDVNGDDRADVLVGSPQFASLHGRAILYSGLDGSVLRTIDAPASAGFFGTSVAGAGDLNGDGVPDFVITAVDGNADGTGPTTGFARAYSGADGSTLLTLPGPDSEQEFGRVLAAGVDLDGDGIGDVAVGSWVFPPTEGDPTGRIRLYSGATGSLLRKLVGKGSAPLTGPAVLLPDATGDGKGELAVGSVLTDRVTVFDGATGKVLATILGSDDDGVGTALGVAGDVNLDGKVDLAIGAPFGGPFGASGPPGQVRVYSIDPKFPPLVRKICLARPLAAPDPDASGVAALDVKPGQQALKVTTKGLAGDATLFLETAPGSASFAEIGALVAGKLAVVYAPGPFTALGVPFLSELAGRRAELRDAASNVVLAATLPTFSAPSVKVKVALAGASATGTLSIEFNKTLGSSKVALSTKGLDAASSFSLWLEDAPASGVFAEVGALAKGKLTLDTKKGDPLPLGVASIGELSGRHVQARDGATVVLDGLVP